MDTTATIMTASNTTTIFSNTHDLPPLPAYSPQPIPPLIPGFPDEYLTLALPIIAYWGVSMLFHAIDTWDLFPQYRLHTPAEVLKRNHVSRWGVFRDVVVQQIVQSLFGIALAAVDGPPMGGTEEHDLAVWARRIRIAQRALPTVLGAVGVDAHTLSTKLQPSHTALAAALSGGPYTDPGFATWELHTARAIYHLLIPALQFALAILIVDTWQYFLHRGMHMNRYLYTRFHARHHRLYVPYAYGALYNHPVEGFVLDTLGTGVAYLVSGMSVRQSMWFFTCSTIKTVDDHCGYAFPWDPLQWVTKNNAKYHDVHHQSWGIKTNFSQPFSTFWDRLLGTEWTGGDVSGRYERERARAEAKAKKQQQQQHRQEKDSASSAETSSADVAAAPVIKAPAPQPQQQNWQQTTTDELAKQRSPGGRRRTTSIGLKGFADRVGESLHGKGTGVLGMESGRR